MDKILHDRMQLLPGNYGSGQAYSSALRAFYVPNCRHQTVDTALETPEGGLSKFWLPCSSIVETSMRKPCLKMTSISGRKSPGSRKPLGTRQENYAESR